MATKQTRNRATHTLCKSLLWWTTMLGIGLTLPVMARAQSAAFEEEVIVSARRKQESAQEVPISITVFDQASLDRNNVVSGADLARYAPSLAVNERFGPDQVSFAIRGFTQELRTSASVGFYFADVVAPRGGGSITAGDGAGPGAFFDLKNVQVLKGPQGTLFGRNTTGGAILLTPQEPTTALEGYLEGSAGDYGLQRVQGVLNVPISERVRARLGVDTMQRDGHLDNTSGTGPGELGDTDYIAARASLVVDVTEAVENYSILSYTDSSNKGVVSSLFACKPGPALFNMGCPRQRAHQGDDIYAVESGMRNPANELEQWQIINTTAWDVNDDLTVKNILSYADLEQTMRTMIYGINYDYYGLGSFGFVDSDAPPGVPTNSQVSYVEELQFQGRALDGALGWQAGLYFEKSEPDGVSGTLSLNQVYCSSVDKSDPAASSCVDAPRNYLYQLFGFDIVGAQFGPNGYGAISQQLGEIEYTNKAIYTEMSYDVSAQWKLTGGLRYTKDKADGTVRQAQAWGAFPYQGAPAVPGEPGSTSCYYSDATLAQDCKDSLGQSSDALTGLIDFDYFPIEDVLLYAKYSRGYRQGSVNIFGGEGLREFDPEHVDAYELGAKTSFGGPVRGTFNVAVFYNDLQDQQIQIGYVAPGIPPTTGIANAGSSKIRGVEVESGLMLLEDLVLNVSYTFLDTQLEELAVVTVNNPRVQLIPSSLPGEDLTFSPENRLVASLDYRLPLPAEVGDVSLGLTYSYTAKQLSTAPPYINPVSQRPSGSPYAWLPSYEIFNLSANWTGMFGSRFDSALFMSNAFDEEYTTYVPGLYNSVGFETRMVGVPRMWGARLRYNFGK